jgi:hypothetical protein
MTQHPDPDAFATLLQAYFNQDWDLDADDPREVLDNFVRDERETDVHVAAASAARLLDAARDEATLEARLRAAGLEFYDPAGDGMTFRQFVELVAERLSAEPG